MKESTDPLANPRARTKIVATVGPACIERAKLAALVRAGVDVFRLNTAHSNPAAHTEVVATIRALEEELSQPIGILVDLAGPKIRLGVLPEQGIECRRGESFWFVRGEGDPARRQLATNYEPLVDELEPGNAIMLADGVVGMRVEEKSDQGVRCQVTQGGWIRSRQGVNLPGARLSVPAMTPTDREYADWAARVGADFVSLSFVRRAQDVQELASLLRVRSSSAAVIAKIEKPEALHNLSAIVEAADGIMVARGDLGVEIDLARIAVEQKRIIDECHRQRKPIITATQMLDSMHRSQRPTRAEATDVANAILDGTDACMLSGETAVGDFPVEAVEMMNRIALATEPLFRDRPALPNSSERLAGLKPITRATVYGADVIARACDARLVVVSSRSGATALAMSKRRLFMPIVGVSSDLATLRKMTLYWGVTPLMHAPVESGAELVRYVSDWGNRDGLLQRGDRFVQIVGTGLMTTGHNAVVVHETP